VTIAVESAVEQKPFAEWLEQDYDYVRPRRGNVQEGVIVSMEEDEAIVHLPEAKRDGLVYGNDLDRLDEEYREALDVGTHVPVRILKGITRDGQIVVSIRQGLDYQDWLRAEELVESGETVECEIIGENKGGLVVSFGRLRGFVPNSHLQRGRSRRREDKAEMAGETVTLVVLEVEQRRRRLVMSERGAHTQQRQKLLQELEEGQILQGKVSNLTDYGAFVDLGGLDGLVHISELDWRFTEHPSEVLSEGDELEVYVLGVDRERERVSLSRKRAIPTHCWARWPD
jgi:small subunit ribosomal protein S1